jgi:hypothetical protein
MTMTKRIESVTLTPIMATKLLEHNRLNRPIRERHVQRISSQIAGGKWKFNGDTIKVSRDGDVLDGQHRLWAVIEAKVPIDTLLVRDIERDAFSTIDTIRSIRTGGDILALNGVTRYRTAISSALQWMCRYENGMAEWKDPRNKVENSDIEAAWSKHPGMQSAVEEAMKLRGLANAALMGFLYYLMSSQNTVIADRMMETLRSPEGVGITDPFFRLRAYFTALHHVRKDPTTTIALAFKAANAVREGKKLQSLTWRNQGRGATQFPKLSIR